MPPIEETTGKTDLRDRTISWIHTSPPAGCPDDANLETSLKLHASGLCRLCTWSAQYLPVPATLTMSADGTTC